MFLFSPWHFEDEDRSIERFGPAGYILRAVVFTFLACVAVIITTFLAHGEMSELFLWERAEIYLAIMGAAVLTVTLVSVAFVIRHRIRKKRSSS